MPFDRCFRSISIDGKGLSLTREDQLEFAHFISQAGLLSTATSVRHLEESEETEDLEEL